MLRGEAFEPRDEFVHAWVVFHRAGAERVHAEVNGVVPGGKPREVPNYFDFADFGKAFDRVAGELAPERRVGIDRWDIEGRNLHSTFARGGLLEDQPFVLIRMRADLLYRSVRRNRRGVCRLQAVISLNRSF